MWVKVAKEGSTESVMIHVDAGFMQITSLAAIFPGATGLKFQTDDYAWHGLKVSDGTISPAGDDTWQTNTTYIVVQEG
jgi:hypothetical protein